MPLRSAPKKPFAIPVQIFGNTHGIKKDPNLTFGPFKNWCAAPGDDENYVYAIAL